MPTRTSYDPGTPSWVDLASADLAASASFYSSLFGWDAVDQGDDAGHYHIFERSGVPVGSANTAMRPTSSTSMGSTKTVPPDALTLAMVASASVTEM